MLSAIAARKARLPAAPPPLAVPSPSPPSRPSSPPRPPKRKLSAAKQTTETQQKTPATEKRKKQRKESKSGRGGTELRYFAEARVDPNPKLGRLKGKGKEKAVDEESFVEFEDPDEDADISMNVDQDVDLEELQIPLVDSSDEDDGEIEATHIQTKPHPGPSIAPHKPPAPILSTFQPIYQQNIFHLEPREVHSLCPDISSSSISEGTSALLHLALGQTATLLGACAVTVLRGALTISGATVLSDPRRHHRIYAPRCAPLPVIHAPSHPPPAPRLRLVFDAKHSALANTEGVLILISPLRSGVDGLGKVVRTFEGVFNPPNNGAETTDLGVDGIHLVTQGGRLASQFAVPSDWETALSAIAPPLPTVKTNEHDTSMPDLGEDVQDTETVCLVKGAKRTGKSTFARTLVNKLLERYSRVAFLETDVGQSEFTPGGMVALTIVDRPIFGPPYTHPSLPYRAHYIGAASPRAAPAHYLACVHDLVQAFRTEVQHPSDLEEIGDMADIIDVSIPLVVNTMGWTKGLGADLTQKIEEMVEPTHICSVAEPTAASFPPSYSARTPYVADVIPNPKVQTYTLQPIAPSQAWMASDMRNIALMSYFHAFFPDNSSTSLSSPLVSPIATSWNTALPLVARPPYAVDPAVALDVVFLTGPGSEDIVEGEIGRVLNGAVVGLVRMDEGADGTTGEAGRAVLPYQQGQGLPDPAMSHCYGLAIVRAVAPALSAPHPTPSPNTIAAALHILTPLPPHLLSRSRALVKGELELPIWGMLDFRDAADGGGGEKIAGVDNARVPYLRWGKGEGAGAERRRVRRNLMRKGQM